MERFAAEVGCQRIRKYWIDCILSDWHLDTQFCAGKQVDFIFCVTHQFFLKVFCVSVMDNLRLCCGLLGDNWTVSEASCSIVCRWSQQRSKLSDLHYWVQFGQLTGLWMLCFCCNTLLILWHRSLAHGKWKQFNSVTKTNFALNTMPM